MTTVSFLPLELKSLELVRAELLVLSVFEDERPLRGLSSLVDWRTGGMLSRFLVRGHVTGAEGESVLFPPGRKVGVVHGLLLGLGPAARFDERRFARVVADIAEYVRRLRLRSLALSLPGLHARPLDLDRAVAAFADVAATSLASITFFASPGERRGLASALERHVGAHASRAGGSSPHLQGGSP